MDEHYNFLSGERFPEAKIAAPEAPNFLDAAGTWSLSRRAVRTLAAADHLETSFTQCEPIPLVFWNLVGHQI